MIERIHLTILHAIEQQGSLTAAASFLNLTQSALSHTIKKLEKRLGTPLWSKQGRKLQLTQAGIHLLQESRRILPQLERLDESLKRYASGEKGSLRLGMECHPCYQWLLKVVDPFLAQWPSVDIDVKQRFQFGGMDALLNYEIDILVTPDPINHRDIQFLPVFDYELVLIVSNENPLSKASYVSPQHLHNEVLYTYPVDIDRLDIFQQFLLPAQCRPKQCKTIEATEIMLQLVAANRGVACLPRWLVSEYQQALAIKAISIGKTGIQKKIHLGIRSNEPQYPYNQAFVELALKTT